MAGKQAELLQFLVIVLNDLRHKLVETDKAAKIFLEDIQLVFLLFAVFEAVFSVGDQHYIVGFFSAFEDVFCRLISLNRRAIALLPALNGRFADIANRGVGFVFRKEGFAKLLDFIPLENTAGAQLLE